MAAQRAQSTGTHLKVRRLLLGVALLLAHARRPQRTRGRGDKRNLAPEPRPFDAAPPRSGHACAYSLAHMEPPPVAKPKAARPAVRQLCRPSSIRSLTPALQKGKQTPVSQADEADALADPSLRGVPNPDAFYRINYLYQVSHRRTRPHLTLPSAHNDIAQPVRRCLATTPPFLSARCELSFSIDSPFAERLHRSL